MKDFKELISTPITSSFLLMGIIISLYSIQIVLQFVFSDFKYYDGVRNFYNKNISLSYENVTEVYEKLKSLEENFITDPIKVPQSHGNGTRLIDVFGVNEYEKLNNIFNFKDIEYENDKDKIIAGYGIKDLTYKVSDNYFIDIKGVSYKIDNFINSKGTKWNNIIIIPFNKIDKKLYELNSNKIINLYKDNNVNFKIEDIKKKHKEVCLINYNENIKLTLSTMWKYSRSKILSLSIGILLGILNCIISSMFWKKDITRNLSIKRILGARVRDLVVDIGYKIIIVNILSFIIVTPLVLISLNIIEVAIAVSINYSILASIYSLMLNLVISVFIALLAVVKMQDFEILNYVR